MTYITNKRTDADGFTVESGSVVGVPPEGLTVAVSQESFGDVVSRLNGIIATLVERGLMVVSDGADDDSDPPDSQDDVEITPEMVEAGLEALYWREEMASDHLVTRIFQVMYAASSLG